jgi:hypothetical protein
MLPAGSTEIVRTTSRPRRSRVQSWLVAGLVLACGGWLSRPAAAGCSHYVASRADVERSRAAGLDPLVAVGELSRDRGPASPLGTPPAGRCSGFGCSGDSAPPTPVPMAVPRIEAWSCVGPIAVTVPTGSARVPLDDESLHSRDRADRLARPPRP